MNVAQCRRLLTMTLFLLFSSSFVQSNDTIVTTTVELVSVCMILVTGCHGKRFLATFVFHLPRVLLLMPPSLTMALFLLFFFFRFSIDLGKIKSSSFA
jgi:hypothetical protein